MVDSSGQVMRDTKALAPRQCSAVVAQIFAQISIFQILVNEKSFVPIYSISDRTHNIRVVKLCQDVQFVQESSVPVGLYVCGALDQVFAQPFHRVFASFRSASEVHISKRSHSKFSILGKVVSVLFEFCFGIPTKPTRYSSCSTCRG